ncbi:Ig-like domain-containing protein [Isobaculum melis]|uniref:LPXTG-motif cell wall anchor domain-containing protein n=1 Tax=Isobaculum melis TaxID=142588 RepID=A0A1H9PTE5_9LACT|nr:Ig-like domain-containing protein [Isobaculum melis]SER51484.1 LPXTG-motif cell wall anchor domain-containing protein [Isobaculum melis]
MRIEKKHKLFKVVGTVVLIYFISIIFGVKDAAAAEVFDVTADWEVLDYDSSLKNPIEDIFVEQKLRPGTELRYASVGFSNIGRANLTMQKVVPLKAGKTYLIDLVYGFHTDADASGFIDFNGVRKESQTSATTPTLDAEYSEVITPTVDQDYVITMSFQTPAYKEVFLMVGYQADGGFRESAVEKPTVTTPEAGTMAVLGEGTAGHTIKVQDSSGQVLGEAVVGATNAFTVQTTRTLAYNEVLSVFQVAANGTESEAVQVTVNDTMKPDAPVVQAIHVETQLLSGTAEANSKVTVKDKNGEILGENFAAADGTISFILTKRATLNENVFVTATDTAGNVSDQTIVNVYTDIVTEEPTITNEDNDQMIPTEKTTSTIPIKEQTQQLPQTGEEEQGTGFVLIGVIISGIAFLSLKYKQQGEHPNEF